MFAVTAGDLNKVKWDVPPGKPFIKFKLNGFTDKTLDNYIEAFEDYMDMLDDAVFKKIPRIVEEIAELAPKGERLKDEAGSEFDALNGFEKAKAIARTVKMATTVSKLPS
jgi:hypothetical protein